MSGPFAPMPRPAEPDLARDMLTWDTSPAQRTLMLELALYELAPAASSDGDRDQVRELAAQRLSAPAAELDGKPLRRAAIESVYVSALAWATGLSAEHVRALDERADRIGEPDEWDERLLAEIARGWRELAGFRCDAAEQRMRALRDQQAERERAWLDASADPYVRRARAITLISLYNHAEAVLAIADEDYAKAMRQLGAARAAADGLGLGEKDLSVLASELGGMLTHRVGLPAWPPAAGER